MLVDSSKRPNADEIERSTALFAMSQDRSMRPGGDNSSPPASSDLGYPFGSTFQTWFDEQMLHRDDNENAQAAILLRNQIHNAEVRRSIPVTDNEPTVDALGTLLRARTISIVPKEVANEG